MVKIMHFKINVSDLMKINLEQERARVAYYQKKGTRSNPAGKRRATCASKIY
jgi:hypothetical protein